MEPTYTLTFDFDENVVGLGYVNEQDEVVVRQDGQWVVTDDFDDERYYDLPYTNVTEDAVELFDRLVSGGNTPSLSDFSEVEID